MRNRYRLIKKFILLATVVLPLASCSLEQNQNISEHDVTNCIQYCAIQAKKTLENLPEDSLPRSIQKGADNWNLVSYKDWTSGFWPGTLWYLYEATNDPYFKEEAEKYTKLLKPLAYSPAENHDLGFMVYCSYGNACRLENKEEYKEVILAAADTLATLFNPKVGTILSWPGLTQKMNWPHNTIVDNMMNLEILFWASKNGGSKHLYDIAVEHAKKTMENQFRDDFSVYHVVIYDTITGKRIKRITHQGYADESMWARGQAWAIYGFTMCYRETGNAEFLDFVQKVADIYLKRLPEDYVPFWDFDAPNIPNEPKDASAAAITASALFELSTYVPAPEKAKTYYTAATRMINSLCDNYLSHDENSAFLKHSTGHKPNNSEIDVSINYADYYFIEALLRYKKLMDGKKLFSTF